MQRCVMIKGGACKPATQRQWHPRRAVAAAAAAPDWRQQQCAAPLAAAPARQPWAASLVAAGAASLLLLSGGAPADAAGGRSPPIQESAGRCDLAALDKFADTRATFSMEASGGGMAEANVDIRG